jgi:putative transposase
MRGSTGERKEKAVLPTIIEVSDDLWERIEPILDEIDPPNEFGRKRADRRAVMNAIVFRLRSGCQWNLLPKVFPDDSTVHRTFQRWVRLGVFRRIWADLVKECDELGGVDWEWQACDGAMGKARLGGISSGQIPRTEPSPARSEAC